MSLLRTGVAGAGAVDLQWQDTGRFHHHVQTDVLYPATKDQVGSLPGDPAGDSSQDECWMWVNEGATAAERMLSQARQQRRVA